MRYPLIVTLLTLGSLSFGCAATDQAGNGRDDSAAEFSVDQVADWLLTSSGAIVIDVRTPEEFAAGHVTGAINIPIDNLENRMEDLQDYDAVVTVCNHGNRASRAAGKLTKAGIANAGFLQLVEWKAAGHPISFGGWK